MVDDLKAMEMDRISDLPRPILHHILSSLSQNDAVKTCVLSKSWRHLWYGRPNVEFCKDDFKGTLQNFISVLEQILIRYQNQNLSIQKLILKMPDPIDPDSAPFFEKWIPIVVRRNIKGLDTFHLCFHHSFNQSNHPVYFDLPSEIFLSESLREIHLEGCKLNQINSSTEKVFSRSLKKLRLYNVKVDKETFERIMSSCPLIEEVSLHECRGLNTIKVIKVNNHNCSLKSFEFCRSYYESYKDPPIEICNVSHIETIKIKRCWDWFEHHHNNLFTRLKSLHLNEVDLTAKLVHIFSCNFPCLEDLELSNCFQAFEEFEMSSRSIKRLSIEADGDPIKFSIDAPNMSEFEYKGYELPANISFSTTSNKWKSKIGLTAELGDTDENEVSEWLQKLDDLLKVLSRSETSVHVLVFCDFDSYHEYGTPDDSIQAVVEHLESCLGSQLCSDYSVWLDVDSSMWQEKTLIQARDKFSVQKTKK